MALRFPTAEARRSKPSMLGPALVPGATISCRIDFATTMTARRTVCLALYRSVLLLALEGSETRYCVIRCRANADVCGKNPHGLDGRLKRRRRTIHTVIGMGFYGDEIFHGYCFRRYDSRRIRTKRTKQAFKIVGGRYG